MDLNSGKLINRNIIHEIPVTDVVRKAVKTMAYNQGFKRVSSLRTDMELSSTMQIGSQERIKMITTTTTTTTKKLMTKNIITKKPKMTNTRKNLKTKNRLSLMRLTLSSLMQEGRTILSYMRKKNNQENNHIRPPAKGG